MKEEINNLIKALESFSTKENQKNNKEIDNIQQILKKIISNQEIMAKTLIRVETQLNSQVKINPIKKTDIFNLIQSDEWPNAVDLNMIANSEEDKIERAENILSILVKENLENKKFLDFGCGEGHVAVEAQKEAKTSIGYDIKKYENWNNDDVLTTDFEKVKENGPYDIILLFDVLDHCKDPIEALKQIHLVGHPGTIVYARCHPWVSRHGGHLYKQLNKAYLHLFLNKIEQKFDTNEMPIQIITNLNTYKDWFKETNFNLIEESPIEEPIEDFFLKNPFTKNKIDKEMNIALYDFILQI